MINFKIAKHQLTRTIKVISPAFTGASAGAVVLVFANRSCRKWNNTKNKLAISTRPLYETIKKRVSLTYDYQRRNI